MSEIANIVIEHIEDVTVYNISRFIISLLSITVN